jgi:hypothetical protein
MRSRATCIDRALARRFHRSELCPQVPATPVASRADGCSARSRRAPRGCPAKLTGARQGRQVCGRGASLRRGQRGSGIGLSLVARIAASHHATIEVGTGLRGRGFGVLICFRSLATESTQAGAINKSLNPQAQTRSESDLNPGICAIGKADAYRVRVASSQYRS